MIGLIGFLKNKVGANTEKSEQGQVPFETICRLEIDKFHMEKGCDLFVMKQGKNVLVDPLKVWWSGKAEQYPNLWRLARKYLAMPASAANSERAFSIAGMIITPKQALLDPQNVENLHFLRENWTYIFN